VSGTGATTFSKSTPSAASASMHDAEHDNDCCYDERDSTHGWDRLALASVGGGLIRSLDGRFRERAPVEPRM
jgi:hypothetical protein